MKHFPFLILILGLLSCTRRQVTRQLSDAESCIQTHPDTALLILSRIDTSDLVNKQVQAEYALLYSIALDKNYIDTTDPRIISPAVQYYEQRGTMREKMLTWYYLGRIQHNSGDDAASMYSMLNALSEAQKMQPDRYLGMIYTVMADLCGRSYSWDEEKNYLNKAQEGFLAVGDSLTSLNIAVRLALNAFNRGKEQDALRQMDSLEKYVAPIASLYKPLLEQRAYILASPQVKDYPTSLRDYSMALSLEPNLSPKHMAMYAFVLEQCGYPEDARSIYDHLSGQSSEAETFAQYRQIASFEKDGRFEDAYNALKQSVTYQNEIVGQALRQSLFRTQRDYYNLQQQQTQTEKERQFFFLLSILLFLILLGSIAIVLIKHAFRRHREKEEQMERLADALRSSLGKEKEKNERYLHDNQALHEQFKGLFALQMKMLETTYLEYEKARRTGAGQKELYEKLLGIIHEIQGDDVRQHLFEDLIDKHMDNVMTRLRNECPDLSKNDRMLFAYTVARFDKSTICMLQGNISSDALNTRRTRMRKYLKSMNPPSLSFFLEKIAILPPSG